MAILNPETVASTGGLVSGAGGTVVLRERLDRPGDDRITRPSVIYGVGTGLAGFGIHALANMGRINIPESAMPTIESHSSAALVSGVFSALYPKGSTTALIPSTPLRSGN